ncbi:MAG: glutamine synthetase type III, partial [Muribaculaceae bacterium]|nr:glutamine synthetase type III [Muribaculaceae bacterium]
FGTIRERIGAYMKDLNIELWKLGVTAKTQHNEVAPAQHELAPIYETANIAVDHNQLVMETMKKVAGRHGLTCLLHEKPFAGVNGSGKHNNWSLGTDKGVLLFSPGKTPKQNLQFITFVVNVMAAVHKHNALMKATIINATNQHRLGANEAPPAIISMFLGTQLSKILDTLENEDAETIILEGKDTMTLDISQIPDLMIDNTDRNRTSPFAFTGNRFEYRAVGSTANCASAMIALNAAVADQLNSFADEVSKHLTKGISIEHAVLTEVKKLIKQSRAIHFDGNGYSDEWKEEAARRGLDVETSAPLMYDAYLRPESVDMFKRTGVLSLKELQARNEVKWEMYSKKIQIESRVLGDLAINHILPAATRYQSLLVENVFKIKQLFKGEKADFIAGQDMNTIEQMAGHMAAIRALVEQMIDYRRMANKLTDEREKAIAYHDNVFPCMEEIRKNIDKLELMVDNEIWPLPKYRELLFIR